jgi:hypothetical protein
MTKRFLNTLAAAVVAGMVAALPAQASLSHLNANW